VCARVGNQRSHGVVTARVRTDAVRSLRHQRRDLHQSTYPVPLGRLGLIPLSSAFRPKAEPGEAFSPIGTSALPTKSSQPAASGRRWSGRKASRQGGRPDWWPQRGEGLTRWLLYGGGDRRRGQDLGKPE
jgi:hypothetical protein